MNPDTTTLAQPAAVPAAASAASPWPGAIPLSWVRSSRDMPYANLGDALSALVVGAISGSVVQHTNFNKPFERLIGIGTIVQDQRLGHLHLWGTGLDAGINRQQPELGRYTVPPDTTITAHAVRGPHTAAALRSVGVPTPAIYGDPAWLLPKILPRSMFPAEPRHELGVVVHITELEAMTPAAGARADHVRYRTDAAPPGSVRIINTLTEPTLDGIIAKMAEILSCRRILSSSFHGLVLPLAYGVPSLTFGMTGGGFQMVDAADRKRLDHRFGDFLAGVGMSRVPMFSHERRLPVTDWPALCAIIDKEHRPLGWTGRDLFEAFPGNKAVAFDDPVWPIPDGLRQNFAF